MKKDQNAVAKGKSSSQSSTATTVASAMPKWLRSTVAELTGRVKAFEADNHEEHNIDDTFAQRAESYYRKQPKLLTLLQDLYNAYISLSDRYILTLTRKHKPVPSRSSIADYQDDRGSEEMESDVESSISFQRTPNYNNEDELVAEFVMKTAEREFVIHELGIVEQRCGESSKKICIQSSLLEVLEAERNVLLSQNKSLGDRAAVVEEENREIVLESDLIRSQANELARCVLELKEEESVGRLLCTIEDLQDRVQWLEKQNMEYYEMIVKGGGRGGAEEAAPRGCFQLGKLKMKVKGKGKKGKRENWVEGNEKSSRKWWWKVKNIGVDFKRRNHLSSD